MFDQRAGNKFCYLAAFAIVLVLIGAFAWASYGQFGRSKYTSPPANVAATIAGKKITVDYYAPSMHGRKVMGGLVPFGEVWCTGANWATKITTEANLQMGTLKLPAGSYSIWTLPNANEWTLIINSRPGSSTRITILRTDFGRTKMNLKTLAESRGNFQNRFAVRWRKPRNACARLGNDRSVDPVHGFPIILHSLQAHASCLWAILKRRRKLKAACNSIQL